MRRWAAPAAVAAAAAAGILVWLLLPPGRHTLARPGFRLTYPGGWRVAAGPALVRPGARLTIGRDEPLRKLDGARLRLQVEHDFSERLADFRLLSAGTEQTPAGSIFVYTYLAPGSRAVHTVALVPAGDRSYDLDAVAPAALGHEIDGIIRSFRPVR